MYTYSCPVDYPESWEEILGLASSTPMASENYSNLCRAGMSGRNSRSSLKVGSRRLRLKVSYRQI
jgi:hypothetical protein